MTGYCICCQISSLPIKQIFQIDSTITILNKLPMSKSNDLIFAFIKHLINSNQCIKRYAPMLIFARWWDARLAANGLQEWCHRLIVSDAWCIDSLNWHLFDLNDYTAHQVTKYSILSYRALICETFFSHLVIIAQSMYVLYALIERCLIVFQPFLWLTAALPSKADLNVCAHIQLADQYIVGVVGSKSIGL